MKSSLSTVALTLLLSANDSTVSAFLPNPSLPSSVVRPFATPKLSPLQAGKGFGSNSPEEPKKKSASPSAATPAEKPSGVVASQQQQQQQLQSPPLQSTELNPGQKALEEIRRARAEKKDAELRKVRELVQTDQQVQETPAVIPEKVAQRMGKRMLPFVGIPLLGSMSAFVAFWYLAVYKNMEFQPMAVAASTIAILVFSLVVRWKFVSYTVGSYLLVWYGLHPFACLLFAGYHVFRHECFVGSR